jgi:multidrug efflux system membrane fusion protein
MFPFRSLPSLSWPALLLLAACTHEQAAAPVRPALVTRASSGAAGYEAFAGEVHAREEPQLAFRVPGKLIRRLVDVGAAVRPGQALAELDPTDLRLESEASAAQLASARSDLALARSELARYKQLVDQQLVSRSLYDGKVSALRAAEARARQAGAQAAASGNQAGYAVLRAPKAGVITQRLAEAGQVVAAGQAVFVLAVDGEREVAISVPEQSIARFRAGPALAVELWAAPGRRFPGQLRELSPAADALTRTYAARVAFASGATEVDLGQSARVYAQAAGNAGMSLPLSALTQARGGAAVWVVDRRSARVHLTPVVVGPYREDGVPVLSGIGPDDWVVAAGAHLLLEGEQVAPIDRDNRPIPLDARGNGARPGDATVTAASRSPN